MKLAVILFMCIVAAVCLFTLIVVIWELKVAKRDRELQKREDRRRRAEEEREKRRREAEDAEMRRAREAELCAMQNAAYAQERAAQAMSGILSTDGRGPFGARANVQTIDLSPKGRT